MKTLQREKANIEWQKWWEEMRSEWFKVEVLQDYSAEDSGPSLNEWLKGNKTKSLKIIKQDCARNEWVNMCQEKVRRGVKLIRVHIIEEPYTPYIEWELEHYKYVNIPKGGEEVYLLNRLEALDIDLPDGDLMIFDKKRAVVNKYNKQGLMTHQTFYDKNNDITMFLELREILIKRAKTL